MKQNTKRAVAGILTAMMTLGAFGIAGCKDKEQGAVLPTTQTQDSTQSGGGSTGRPMVNNEVYGNPYAGTIVRCGQTYNFTGGSIGFLAEELTGLSEDEAYTVDLIATVEPADAAQEVRWAVAFVNPESEWATGKDVSDYVSIEYSEEESTKLSVTCKKGFSEQVKITCTYLHNADISVDCIVDFVSAWENVTLKMGDDVVNLGGVTDVWWEQKMYADTGIAWGGDVSLDIQTAEAGTVTGYTYRVDLLSPRAWHEQGNLQLVYDSENGFYKEYYTGDSGYGDTNSILGYYDFWDSKRNQSSHQNFLGNEDGFLKFVGSEHDFCFDNSNNHDSSRYFFANRANVLLDYSWAGINFACCDECSETLLELCGVSEFPWEQTPEGYDYPNRSKLTQLTVAEGSLCTVLLTVTSASGTQMQYMSLLNLTEFRYTPKATAVSLSSSKIKVSYEP